MNSMQKAVNANRMPWIDLLRVIAIILVLCHSSEEGIYELSLTPVLALRPEGRFFPFLCFTLGRLGVPIFLLISGYLLLDREYDVIATKRFWKRNWIHLIRSTMFWFLVYDLFLVYFKGTEMKATDVIQDVLFLNKVNMSHVWYMPMIIGLYACIPIVANALKMNENRRTIILPFVFFFVVLFIYPTVALITRLIDPEIRSMSNQIGYGFSGGTYGVYLIMGWLLNKGLFKKIKSCWLITIFGVSLFASVWMQLWAYRCEVGYNIWYDNPFLFITAVTLFELVSRLKICYGHKVLKWLSGYAFGVYLIHFPFKLILLEWVLGLTNSREIKVVIMWGMLLIIGFVTALLISLIPRIGNYLIYRKY